MMTLVLLGLVMFDMALEAFENYLHRLKGRFHRRLHNKVRGRICHDNSGRNLAVSYVGEPIISTGLKYFISHFYSAP